jgi:hypothetical protein
MVRNAHCATVVAALNMTTKLSGAAVQNVGYDFAMFRP